MIERSKKESQGFLIYQWEKPGEKPGEKGVVAEKLAYFKLIQKWGWIIGTGRDLCKTRIFSRVITCG